MNRFTGPSLKKRIADSAGFSIMFFVVVMIVFIVGVSMISTTGSRDEKTVLETALNRDIIHCYAVEGYYPPSLEYIEDHYGLTYNHSKYIVDYESIGSNIMPTFAIYEKKPSKSR